jgi:multiple sugar transport system ATP-binding protein
MNIIAWNDGYLGFRPENLLPREMIDDGDVTEFSYHVDRWEYLGSERIVYGKLAGVEAAQEVTAKLPPAHVSMESIRPGEQHAFGVRNNMICYFNRDGARAHRH